MAKRRSITMTAPIVPGMRSLPAVDLETIRQEVIELVRASVDQQLVRILDVFPAVTVATTPTEFTDERYSIKRSKITTSDGDPNSQITLSALGAGEVRYRHITATSLAELPAHTHLLPTGSHVWVVKVRDDSSPPVERFLIIGTPAATVIPVVAQGAHDGTADPPLFSAKRATNWTGAAVVGDQFYVMLPYSTGDYPNVRTGDVIGVIPSQLGTRLWLGSAYPSGNHVDVPYVAVTDTANAELKFGMFWAGAAIADIPAGWEVFAEGRFLVGYAAPPPQATNYNILGAVGGYNWHGPTENNHVAHGDHCHSHPHCHCENQALTVKTTAVCGDGSTYVVCQVTIDSVVTAGPDQEYTSGGDPESARGHVGNEGPSEPSGNNVDNRPQYLVVAWLKRTS